MKGTANKASSFLTKYAMVIALVIVFVLFAYLTDWRLLYHQNMSNLMLQNGYVLVMACGMLLCILTGGNIDLSIGSVICLVGGLAAVMITNMSMNPILTIVICLVVGLLVGVWQGYWIGYVRIPPFITTLGGMFIFRGIGRLILDNKTVAVQDSTFLNIFTKYIKIPGLDDGDTVYSALIVGVVAALFVLFSTAKNRRERAKNGYRQNSMVWDYLKAGIIAALILYYCYLLSQYRGISVMLVWVVAICLIYNFITARLPSAVTSTRWAATRKPPSSPVSTPIRSTSSPTPTWACWPACAACSMPPAWVPSTAPPVPPLRWTPSAPASSAALPLTAVAAPWAAWSSALCCWASSTWACPSWASATLGSMWSRAACCWSPSSSTWSPAVSLESKHFDPLPFGGSYAVYWNRPWHLCRQAPADG